MFNLLPDNLRIKIKLDYNHRRLVTVLIFMIITQASFLVFIFPTWITSFYKEKEVSGQLQKNNNTGPYSNIDTVTPIIKSINSKLNVLNNTLEYPKLLPYINIVLAQRNSSIHINQISFTSLGANTGTLSLNGISSSRESLVSFVKSLNDTNKFKSVDSPISNFAKEKNISFSVVLSIVESTTTKPQ